MKYILKQRVGKFEPGSEWEDRDGVEIAWIDGNAYQANGKDTWEHKFFTTFKDDKDWFEKDSK